MDLVIPIADNTKNDFFELRFALRSFEKCLTGVSKLFIVGTDPGFLRNVFLIPVQDELGTKKKEKNICKKVEAACLDKRVSENFLFANDDHFLLAQYEVSEFPYYYHNTIDFVIQKRAKEDAYKLALSNTQNLLAIIEKPRLYFDVHCPIIYNRGKFIDVVCSQNWNLNGGYIIKSLYSNQLDLTGTYLLIDKKFHWPFSTSSIRRKIKDHPFFCTDDNAINDDMKTVLQELYPDPSRWEK